MYADMICADGNMLRGLCELLRNAKRAAPIERLHASVGQTARAGIILASGDARNLERWRMAEDFFLRPLRRHAPVCQHNKFFANAVRLFEIVAHEQRRSAVVSQC